MRLVPLSWCAPSALIISGKPLPVAAVVADRGRVGSRRENGNKRARAGESGKEGKLNLETTELMSERASAEKGEEGREMNDRPQPQPAEEGNLIEMAR